MDRGEFEPPFVVLSLFSSRCVSYPTLFGGAVLDAFSFRALSFLFRQMDPGTEGQLTWFNAGLRVGVGVGLGMCLGLGLGVGVLIKAVSRARALMVGR